MELRPEPTIKPRCFDGRPCGKARKEGARPDDECDADDCPADVHALADGPFGMLVVGSKSGKKGRALFVGLDDQITLFVGANDKPALRAAVSGAGMREAWAPGQGVVKRFDAGLATVEKGARHAMAQRAFRHRGR